MKTEIQRIREDVLSDLLFDVGISLSKENLESVTSDFYYHIEMEHEMSAYAHAGPIACDECKSKSAIIKDLQRELDCYKNGMKRTKNASAVWLENGDVVYELGNGSIVKI